MRALLVAALALLAPLLPAQTPPPAPPPVSVAGNWAMTIEMEVGTATPSLTLAQKADKLTGTYSGRYGDFAVEGIVTGKTVAFAFHMGDDGSETMSFTGEVAADGQSIKGTATMGDMGEAKWSAVRAK